MTRRDRTLHFVSLTGFDEMFRRQVDQLTGQFKSGFQDGFGDDVPDEAREALRVVETAFTSAKGALQNQIAEVYEKHLDEGEIAELVAFHASPVGKKLLAIGPEVQVALGELTDKWERGVLKTIEPDLARLLGMQTAAPLPAPPERTTPAPGGAPVASAR